VALPCPYVPMSVAWPQRGQYITLKQEAEPMIDFIDLEDSEEEMVLAKDEEGWSEVEDRDAESAGVAGTVYHEEGMVEETELTVAIRSIQPVPDLEEGLGSSDASSFCPAITVAPKVLEKNLKAVPVEVNVAVLNPVVTTTPPEAPRPDTIPEVGGSTPVLDVPAGIKEYPRIVERVVPAIEAVVVEADTSIAGNSNLNTVPAVGGSTPELGVPVVIRESSSSIAPLNVQNEPPNICGKDRATVTLVPTKTSASSIPAPATTKPREKGEHRQLPAGARLKTIVPKTDSKSDSKGGKAEVKPNPPAPIQTAVAGKKPTAAAGFHKSAKNPPVGKNRKAEMAARRNPTESAGAQNSEGAVPYTPSRLGNVAQYSPTFPQMDRSNHLIQVNSTGQLHYHPTPLGQYHQSVSPVAIKSGAEPAATVDPQEKPTNQSRAAGITNPSEKPWLPNHSGFQLNPPAPTNTGVAVGITGSRDTSTPEAPTVVPAPARILSHSLSVASSHGGSDTPASFRRVATGEESCPPDHVLRGIVSFVAFDMGRWERGPMTAAIHSEFGAAGLSVGQCQAYGMVAMEALQAAATACQSRYETGDTNHITAIQTWRRGIIRKIDRLPSERTASVESVSREWPGYSSNEPEGRNPTPKRSRMDIPSEGLEFLELAPRPDMSYNPETVITSPRPGELRRRPSATIVRPEPVPATVAPPWSVVGDSLLSTRGDLHMRDLPNGIDAGRAGVLFPPPRRVGPVPSLLRMPAVQPTVSLRPRNLGPGAAWRTTNVPSGITPPYSSDVLSHRSSISPTFHRLARRLTQDDRRLVRPPAPSHGSRSPSKKVARSN